MEQIIAYFMEAVKALLALLGKTMPEFEIDEEFKSNLESMYDNMSSYQPGV